MFKSKKEFALALLEGRKFKTPNGVLIEYDEEDTPPFRSGNAHLSGMWKCYRTVTEVKPWYENIPEHGVLCYVWDDDIETKEIAIVVAYDSLSEFPYTTGPEDYFIHATPLTKEEAMQLIYQED